MSFINKHKTIEHLIYIVFWVLLFAFPFSGYLLGVENQAFDWKDIFRSWISTAPLLLLFIIHNYLLMPYLLFKRRVWVYLFATLAVFVSLAWTFRSVMRLPQFDDVRPFYMQEFHKGPFGPRGDGNHPFDARRNNNEPEPLANGPDFNRTPGVDAPRGLHHDSVAVASRQPQNLTKQGRTAPQNNPPQMAPKERPNGDSAAIDKGQGMRSPKGAADTPRKKKPAEFNISFGPNFLNYLLALFVLVFNFGVSIFFRSLTDGERMKELQQENLRSALDYLKYQINPHFLMNTLNNIHALIDIDPAMAQRSLMELSKMMRHVLYDASNNSVSLDQEIVFLNNYIELMRLRLVDDVEVNFEKSGPCSSMRIPPLILIVFVENAFKYGVSYRSKSLIDIHLEAREGRVYFTCKNTYFGTQDSSKPSGIGIENVKKRLNLLYQDDYTLHISHDDEFFDVELNIPSLT